MFCVLGAGHGGLALAGHLALVGLGVHLWNRSEERIHPILERGSVDLEGAIEGRAPLRRVTCDLGEALEGTDVVMVAIPANGHLEVAARMAPFLRPGQLVVLNPGRTGGALEVSKVFREAGVHPEIMVAEAQTFLYVSRRVDGNRTRIFEIKNSVPLASLPACGTPDALRSLALAFPQFVAGANVLETSYGNMGMVFHPAVTMLNAGWIESDHDFEYYREGISPSVAQVLERLDRERQAVARAVGVRTRSAHEWLRMAYDAPGGSLYEAVQATPAYVGVKAPNTMIHRYLLEEVPMSLVPTSETGRQYGVATPTIDALIHIASVMLGCDFWKEGRTLVRLGITGMSVRELRRAVGGVLRRGPGQGARTGLRAPLRGSA